MGDLRAGAFLMPNRNYYPLPSAASGGALQVWNMDPGTDIERYTGNPRGGITAPFTVNVTGGVPPYTYAWTELEGLISINLLDSGSVIFSAFGGVSPTIKTGRYSVTVTDSSTPTPATITKYKALTFYFDVSPP